MAQRQVSPEILRERVGKNVQAFRSKKGLTLKDAAEQAEMHWRQWQKVESGEMDSTMLMLVQIADVLEIDPAELFSD